MKNLARLLGLGSNKTAEEQSSAAFEPEKENSEETMQQSDVEQVAVAEIVPNPFQPRKTFLQEALQELSDSIREFGVIQPLLLRKKAGKYEIVAGERRLRASKLAGLEKVPAIIKELDDREMAELAMIENLQREDLHYLEEAEGLASLLQNFGFTQEALAKRMGKSQSTIANKLRLLKLAQPVRELLCKEKLTERHARALLKLQETKQQLQVVQIVVERSLNVRQTELLIEEINSETESAEEKQKHRQKIKGIIRDVRIFLNTIHQVTGVMKKNGLDVDVEQKDEDDYIIIQMKIPKRK